MAAASDLTYFGKDDSNSAKDQVTPFKIAVLVLIDEFVKSSRDEDVQVFTQKQERDMMILILQLVQGADMDLKELYVKIDKINCHHVVRSMLDKMRDLCCDGVSAIMDLLQSVPDELCQEPHPYVQRSSVIGLYIRRMHLAFDKLTFSHVTKLHSRYKTFYVTWTNRKENEFSIYGKPSEEDFDTSENNESISIMMGRTEKDDDYDHDLSCGGKYSQRQAELFIAQQLSMLQHNELEAMPPHQLQQNVMELLVSNPDLAEAHFLAYLNNMRINEYVGAVKSLFHYFDRKLMASNSMTTASVPKDKTEDEVINLNFRYAALNMASLHYRFGHWGEALSCVEEAIKLAQEFNDHICLQHALSWLQRLGVESGDNSVHLLERLMTKSGELNMPYLMSLGIQSFARHIAMSKAQPSHVFDLMIRSDIFNCQNFHISLICSGLSQKAALWHMYGKREMCSLNCQVLLNLETGDMGMYHNDEAECLALCQLSVLHTDQGLYDTAFGIIDCAKRRYPCNTQFSHIWILQEQILIFRRAIHHGKWAIAEQSVLNMKAVKAMEAKYCNCVLLKEKGEMSSAFENVVSLLQECKAKKSDTVPEIHARLLMLQAELYCATSNPTAASQPLLECITLSKQHHFAQIRAVATLLLAFVQLCLGLPQHGLELIHRVLVTILAHGSLSERAKAYYLAVKCKVAAATNKNDPVELQKVQLEGVKTMNEVITWFKSVEDDHRTKDAYYYQAKLYDQLGYKAERNKCALNFRLLDQHYPTWHKGQVLRL